MSFELHELVAPARSPCSTSRTLRPRPAASRAMPQPLMPPPTTRRSMSSKKLPLCRTKLRPPQQGDHRLGIRDQALPHPRQRIGDLRLEHLQVLARVEGRADVLEAAGAVEVDDLVG